MLQPKDIYDIFKEDISLLLGKFYNEEAVVNLATKVTETVGEKVTLRVLETQVENGLLKWLTIEITTEDNSCLYEVGDKVFDSTELNAFSRKVYEVIE